MGEISIGYRDMVILHDESDWLAKICIKNWKQEKIITCILDTLKNHWQEKYNETFLYPGEQVPHHLVPYIAKIVEILESFESLPKNKQNVIKDLQNTFPFLRSYNFLEEHDLQHYQYWLLWKKQKMFLLSKEVEYNSNQYHQAYEVLKKYESSLRIAKNIKKQQSKITIAKECFDNASNQSLQLLANDYRLLQHTIWKSMIEKKQQSTKNIIWMIDQEIQRNIELLQWYEVQIVDFYTMYKDSCSHALSLQEFIEWYNGEFDSQEITTFLKNESAIQKKYNKCQDTIISLSLRIEWLLSQIQVLIDNWLVPWSQDIQYASLYLEQKEQRDLKQKRWLSPKEQSYQRAWESLRDAYIVMRRKVDDIKEVMPVYWDTINKINKDLIITKDHTDHLQSLAAQYGRLDWEIQFNDSEDLKVEHDNALRNYEQYHQCLDVIRKLMEQYRMFNSVENKQRKEQELERLQYEHKIFFALPNAIKDIGSRKFDSMYVEFMKWMRKNNQELSWISPCEYLKNHWDKKKIIDLIEQLPVYNHNK